MLNNNVLYNILVKPLKNIILVSQMVYLFPLAAKPELVLSKTAVQQQESCILCIQPGWTGILVVRTSMYMCYAYSFRSAVVLIQAKFLP